MNFFFDNLSESTDKVGSGTRYILTKQAAVFAGCWLLMKPLDNRG